MQFTQPALMEFSQSLATGDVKEEHDLLLDYASRL